MAELIRSIQENEIQELKLHGRYHISAADVAALAEALETNFSVQKLKLQFNKRVRSVADAEQKIKDELQANLSLNTLSTF